MGGKKNTKTKIYTSMIKTGFYNGKKNSIIVILALICENSKNLRIATRRFNSIQVNFKEITLLKKFTKFLKILWKKHYNSIPVLSSILILQENKKNLSSIYQSTIYKVISLVNITKHKPIIKRLIEEIDKTTLIKVFGYVTRRIPLNFLKSEKISILKNSVIKKSKEKKTNELQ